MRFRQWINEGINVPPHMPRQWFQEIGKKAEQIEQQLVGFMDKIRQAEDIDRVFYNLRRELPYALSNILETLGGKDTYGDRISTSIQQFFYWVDSDYAERDRLVKLTLESMLRAEQWSRKEAKSFVDLYSNVFRRENKFVEILEDLKYNVEHGYMEKEEYEQATQLVQEVKTGCDLIMQYIQLARHLAQGVKAIKERQGIGSGWGQKTRPEHKPVEVLYHATPFVREILANGFKTKEQLGGREVLGGATENAISFTADINIAKAIAQALRDVIAIAQGRLTMKDIGKLMSQEKISARGSEWARGWRDYQMKKQHPELYQRVHGGDFASSKYNDIRQTFELYRYYLINTQLRYNPWFFGTDVETFKSMDANNVGVIAAQCDMAKVVNYYRSMEEFRVPPEAVLRVSVAKS